MNMFKTAGFSVRIFAFLAAVVSLSLVTGCQIHPTSAAVTYPPPVGSNLLITEVYTLPPDQPYAYSWIEITNPTRHQIAWYDTTTPTTIFAVGAGGVVTMTSNSGTNWNLSGGTAPSTLRGLQLFQYDTAYAVGDAGAIYLTRDSGKTFSQVNPANITDVNGDPVTANLNDLDIVSIYNKVDNKLGLAFGDGGTVLATQNAGVTWSGKTSNTTANLHAFTHISVEEEFVVGDGGTVIRSTNLGFTWDSYNTPRPVNLYGAASTVVGGASGGAESTWVCGAQGYTFHNFTTTGSGGRIGFIAETTNTHADLYGISFVPGGLGWAVGDSGTIIHTSNDGHTWSKQYPPVSSRLTKVTFLPGGLRGWAFGTGGIIIATQDGGVTWEAEYSGTSQDLYGIVVWPTNETVQSFYEIRMLANRKQFYQNNATGTVNFNYFTHIDTGYVWYNPTEFTLLGAAGAPSLEPGAFTVLVSDSSKFQRHYTQLPPSSTYYDGTAALLWDYDTLTSQKLVEWTLLERGEVALIRIDFLERQGSVIQNDTTVVDLVRYGGYRPHPDPFPNNDPAAPIPQYWSLARYQNDVGSPNPQLLNTAASFYLCNAPLPGWPSQLRK
jgi:photosystem II stability/assembly factor-like uncharacterized protein